MQKTYYFATGTIFLLITLLHTLRLFYGWHAVIGGWSVSMWLSWFALALGLFLSLQAFGLGRKIL